jgi:aspartyl-tRNA(Asn)/glutamyl-tRNA(Gln) amidotransferase subunit B
MDKLSKISAFLLFACKEKNEEEQKMIGAVAARILMNEVAPLLNNEDTEWHEVEHYHYGFTELIHDCALLQAYGFIESRHVKKIIKDCFSFPYVGFDLVQYAQVTKIFDEAAGDDLLKVVRDVLADPAYAKAVEQVKDGKEKAIGALVGAVMKKVKGDPKQINTMLKAEMNV